MKLKSNIFAKWAGIIAGCALVIACSDLSELEERVDDLDSRVTALETQVENLNTSIEAIQAIAEAGNVITGITKNNGEYTITTSDGKTYTLKQGESGKTPQIGINEDGNWQVRYDNGDGTWTDWTVINVGDSDTPASAVAVVPQFRVNDEGNWEISTNGGVNFNPVYKEGTEDPVPATGDSGSDIFKSVTYSPEDGLLHIVMHDDTELDVLVVSDFGCSIWNEAGTEVIDYDTPVSVPVNTTVRFTVKTTNVTALDIEAPSGWETVMGDIDASGTATLEVTAPDKAESVELTKITSNSKRDVTIHATNKDGKSTFAKIQVRAVAGDIPEVTVTAAETQGFNILTFSFADAQHLTSYRYLLYKAGTMEPGESAFPASSEINIADASDIDDLEISKTADGAALEFGTDYVLYVLPVNTTSAGITTGNIIKVEASTRTPEKYSDLYEAGIDFTIGDVTINKTTYGEAKIIDGTTNTTINSATTGSTTGTAVYFVEAGTADFNTGENIGNMIVIGNSLNGKSEVKIAANIKLNNTTYSGDDFKFIFHNISVKSSLSGTAISPNEAANNGKTRDIIFSDCDFIQFPDYNLIYASAQRTFNKVAFTGCNFDITDRATNKMFIQFGGSSQNTEITEFVFENNIVYSKTATGTDFRFIGMNLDGQTTGNMVVKNNTFVNAINISGNGNPVFFVSATVGNLTCDHNLVYIDTASGKATMLYCKTSLTAGTCNNNYWYAPNSGSFTTFHSSIPSIPEGCENMTKITTSPFSDFDLENGTFPASSSYTGYGAER